jgi:type IV pilus assembly protein PilN
MRHINLLPWREEQRRLSQRRFYHYTLGLAGVAILVLVLVVMDLRAMVAAQRHRNEYLRQQINSIDARIGQVQGQRDVRKRVSERLTMVHSLQQTRLDLVHILDALPRTVPAGVVLSEVKQTGDAWEIHGTGSSNAEISRFVRNLDDSPWFHSARLSEVSAGKGQGGGDSDFVLEVGSGRPETEQ